jgi:hypothetical protein
VIVRKVDGPKYFGLQHTALDEAIENGEIEKPFALTANGRARGWFGWQINKHHKQIREEAPKREEERRAPKAAKEAAAAEADAPRRMRLRPKT